MLNYYSFKLCPYKKKKKATYVFLKKWGFIANYFFKIAINDYCFTTVTLCGVFVLAEQSASVFNTSQLCACCSENNSKTISWNLLDLRTAVPSLYCSHWCHG